MGWEDRDWAKWTEPERERYYGSRTPARRTATATHGRAEWLLLAAGISAVVSAAVWYWQVLPVHLPSGRHARAPVVSPNVASRVVHLAATAALDAPAPRAERWGVDDQRFGRIAVVVPRGRIPRAVLTAALAARGYRVVVDGSTG